jgi:type III restriction enzyme
VIVSVLMWREPEYSDLKRENREGINAGQDPGSLIDVLSIGEHPVFQPFYDELLSEGLAGFTGDDSDNTSAMGEVIVAELREGFKAFDFGIPFSLQETDQLRERRPLDMDTLPPFSTMDLQALPGWLGKGDTFISQDLQSATLLGDDRVDGAALNVAGHNDGLSRPTRRISQAVHEPLSKFAKTGKVATHLAKPCLQVNTTTLTGWLDDCIWPCLFGDAFNPLEGSQGNAHGGENWRVLLLQPVVEVHARQLSDVSRLRVREAHSMPVFKCVYTRLGWPARNSGLERALIQWAQADAQIQAFCKISENRHAFARLRYVKDDGLPVFYSPDCLVRTEDGVHEWQQKWCAPG